MRGSTTSAPTSETASSESPGSYPAEVEIAESEESSLSYQHRSIAVALLVTLLAVPIFLSNSDSGAVEVRASDTSTSTTAASTSSSTEEPTTAPPSTGESSDRLDPARTELAAALQLLDEDPVVARQATEPEPSTTAAPTTAAPTTAAPTTAAPTTAAPTTAAPTTAAPTTAAPTTAAPTTAAPTTAAPTTAPTTALPTTEAGNDGSETTVAPTTVAPTTAAPTTAAPTTAAPTTEAPTDGEPTPAQWEVLRQCESGGDYSIVSRNGLYYGAYQFHRDTWNELARRVGRADLVGLQPNHAAPHDQDMMALELWRLRGWGPWPHCGKKAAAAA